MTNIPNAMKVAVGIRRTVVIDDDVDTLNIDTTTEDISGDEDAFLKRLESGVTGDTAADGHENHTVKARATMTRTAPPERGRSEWRC